MKSITLSESYHSLAAKAGLSKEIKASGEFYSTIWNGKDDNNRSLASGTYIVRVSADGHTAVRKILVLK